MIKNFEINNYRMFKNAKFDDFANVNLFIGENSTGKTTILKFLYAILFSVKEMKQKNINDKSISEYINKKYTTRTIYHSRNNKPITIILNNKLNLFSEGIENFLCEVLNSNNDSINSDELIGSFEYNYQPLFIPAKEILSIMGAINYFKSSNIRSGFDASYTDIVSEIIAEKNINEDELLIAFNNKYNFYDGNIKIDENTKAIRYYKNDNEIYNMNITAEGIKKLGIFEVLHRTGNLTKNSILFIDEPENSLHPKMVRELMRFLVDISKEGVQIFMSSHNSFVLNQLSNIAEKDNYTINVYFFIKENDNENYYVKIEGAYNLANGFPDNSISDEAYDMFMEGKSE